MKRVLIFAGFALLLTSACQQQEQPVSPADNGQKVVITEITGAFMDEPETKTAFADGDVAHGSALHINWSAADMVNVWFNTTAADIPFTSTNTAPASSVSFSGSLSVLTGTGEDGSDTADYMYGYYPYSEENTISNGVITATLPSIQEAVEEDNIANNLNPWAARSTNWALKFYNVGCWFRFKVSRDDIEYVELSGNNKEKIAGEYSIGFDDNSVPTIVDCSNGAKVIRLNAPVIGNFATDTWYYIALLPTEFTEGFTLKAFTASQIGKFTTSSSVSFDRGSYISYTSMATSMTFQDREPSFTVGVGKRVVFAPSNLQYTISTNTWSFTEYPYTIVETQGQNVGSEYADQDVVSLFGWATSGYENNYPYMTDSDYSHNKYGPAITSGEFSYDWDWGKNINDGYTWRTPTKDEWAYVLNTRKEEYRFEKCSLFLDEIAGLILFPDGFDPLGYGSIQLTYVNTPGAAYS